MNAVQAAEELVKATAYLYPGAKSNGLFENFEAYGQGDKFANIGWEEQQILNSDKSKMKGACCSAACPAAAARSRVSFQARPISTGAGTMWCRASRSSRRSPTFIRFSPVAPKCRPSPCATPPAISIRFAARYQDPEIQKTYTKEFLDAHKESMANSIPDLYLKGQGEYFDELAGQSRRCRCRNEDAEAGHGRHPPPPGRGSPAGWGRAARKCSGSSSSLSTRRTCGID